MLISTAIVILAGAILGGFISGLAGFGTGLVSLGIWLFVLTPSTASTLVIICSVISQLLTISTIWKSIDARRLWPMVFGGILGVPVGTKLLRYIDPMPFNLGMGIFLLGFSSFMLFGRHSHKLAWGGRAADGVVGVFSGILGGLSGLSGPLPTMWAALRGWGRDERRSVFQVFNLTILFAALVTHAASGLLTKELGGLSLITLPGTVIGASLGIRVYRRLSDMQFHKVVFLLLMVSGATLLLNSLLPILFPEW